MGCTVEFFAISFLRLDSSSGIDLSDTIHQAGRCFSKFPSLLGVRIRIEYGKQKRRIEFKARRKCLPRGTEEEDGIGRARN